MTQAPIDPGTFRNVLGQFCTGITVITTMHDDAPVGFACQSFAALSLEPPLVLFCPTKVSRSWRAIEASGRFCVNVLTEKQKHISARFGSKESDKFARIDWEHSQLGSPIISGSLAHIDCTVASVHDGGDHFVAAIGQDLGQARTDDGRVFGDHDPHRSSGSVRRGTAAQR